MTTFGNEILGRRVGRYVETDEPPGLTLPQTVGGHLWAPATVMGLALVATAFALAATRSQMSVDLSEEFTPVRQANLEVLGQLIPGFMFLGLGMIFAAISFAIARILGIFRTGGGVVQQGIGKGIKTPLRPVTVMIFLAGMMMAMMVLVFTFVGHVYAATQAHDAWINATSAGIAGNEAALGRAETWGTWLEGLRRFAVGLYLTSIAFGLATIIKAIGFLTMRMRELTE